MEGSFADHALEDVGLEASLPNSKMEVMDSQDDILVMRAKLKCCCRSV